MTDQKKGRREEPFLPWFFRQDQRGSNEFSAEPEEEVVVRIRISRSTASALQLALEDRYGYCDLAELEARVEPLVNEILESWATERLAARW